MALACTHVFRAYVIRRDVDALPIVHAPKEVLGPDPKISSTTRGRRHFPLFSSPHNSELRHFVLVRGERNDEEWSKL